MHRRWSGITIVASLHLAGTLTFGADPLRMRQVLDAAVAKADRDGSAQSIAEAQLGLLRSLSRTRVELRPQAGIFSFSQPSLLATTAGAGVVVSRRTAPGEPAIQSAELDVLSSQIARKRAKLRTEVESAKLFFDLLAKQETAQRTCAALEDSKRRQPDTAKLVKTAQITAVDMVRFEERTLQQQTDCIDADTQRKLASVQLAHAMGVTDQNGELQVTDVDLPLGGTDRPLPEAAKLLDVAMMFRPEPKAIEEQIVAARPRSAASSMLRPDLLRPESISAGFYRVQENHNAGGVSGSNYLLGGNTMRAEATWNIGLRKTGEQAAASEVLDAKVRALDIQLEAMRDEIRNELASIRVLAAASMEKLPVARRKLDLVSRGRTLVAARFQSGLTSSSGVFDAEQEAVRAQAGVTQALCELKASMYIMLALAGIEDKTVAEQDRLLGYTQASLR